MLALDLPGRWPGQGVPFHRVEALAEWLLAVLDTIGVERWPGRSLAGERRVALETVAIAGGRVTGLGLVATAL